MMAVLGNAALGTMWCSTLAVALLSLCGMFISSSPLPTLSLSLATSAHAVATIPLPGCFASVKTSDRQLKGERTILAHRFRMSQFVVVRDALLARATQSLTVGTCSR